MRRVWFKEEMKAAILAGKKTATTRAHQIPRGLVQAVSGSRFNAKRFAILKITSNKEIGSLVEHCTLHHSAEGFEYPHEMAEYLRKNLPQYLKAPRLYYHTFKLKPRP